MDDALAPVPFVIVADLRTGSTLLSSTLDRHPQVRCYGELLHPSDLRDNCPPGVDRHAMGGEALVRRALAEPGVRAAGFRAMVFLPLPETPQWRDGWSALRVIEELRVIHLSRRDRLAQYVSEEIARRTGAWHPAPGDDVLHPDRRPTLEVDPDAFRAWRAERDRMTELRRAQLQGRASIEIDYESLTEAWDDVMRRIQRFLDVGYVDLPPAKGKQERRPLDEVVRNARELREEGILV